MNIYLISCDPPAGTPAAAREEAMPPEDAARHESAFPAIRALTGQIDFIIASKQPRAAQLCDMLSAYFKCPLFVEYDEGLETEGAEEETLKKINKLIGKENLVVIGRNPNLGKLISAMTKSPEGESEINLQREEIALVNYRGFILPGQGRLKWVKKLS